MILGKHEDIWEKILKKKKYLSITSLLVENFHIDEPPPHVVSYYVILVKLPSLLIVYNIIINYKYTVV